MLNEADVYTLSAGEILYNTKHSYMYSGLSDGTFFWFYCLDDDADPDGDPDIALTKTDIKRLNRV